MKGSTFQRIFSSGGIVYRKGHPGIRIALICRQGGTIWCLPKGHIEKGESLREAALREVQEETGLTGQVEGKVGEITYWYASREEKAKFLKKVTFFLVKHTGGSTKDHDFEVDQVSWFSVEEALAKMSYPSERKLLKKGMGLLQRMEMKA